MNFNIIYLPRILLIDLINCKDKNNNLNADLDDVGSRWAIDSEGWTRYDPSCIEHLRRFWRLRIPIARVGNRDDPRPGLLSYSGLSVRARIVYKTGHLQRPLLKSTRISTLSTSPMTMRTYVLRFFGLFNISHHSFKKNGFKAGLQDINQVTKTLNT